MLKSGRLILTALPSARVLRTALVKKYKDFIAHIISGIAQWIVHPPSKREVAGSTPVATIFPYMNCHKDNSYSASLTQFL